MARVLITGISGQTGSYLAEELVAAGWDVSGIVRDADEVDAPLPGIGHAATLIQADFLSADSVKAALDAAQPDVVVNLAALSSVGQSWNDPEQVAIINAVRVGTFLDYAQRTGARVVQASSAEIFGDAAVAPQNEATPIAPVNPYGASKAYGHLLVGAYRANGVSATSLILYNHESPRRPVSFVTRKITDGVARIKLGLAETLTLGTLDTRRDWGWAPDYAHAIALAASGPAGDYVIATGHTHTVRDFVAAAFAAAGIADWQDRVTTDPQFARARDAVLQQGDATRAREVLGWSPTVGFDELVRRMVEHDLELLGGGAR